MTKTSIFWLECVEQYFEFRITQKKGDYSKHNGPLNSFKRATQIAMGREDVASLDDFLEVWNQSKDNWTESDIECAHSFATWLRTEKDFVLELPLYMVTRRGERRLRKFSYDTPAEEHREKMHEVEPVYAVQSWLADATWCKPGVMQYGQLDGDLVTFDGHYPEVNLTPAQVQQAKDLGLYDNDLAWEHFVEKYDHTDSPTSNAQPPIRDYSYKARKLIGACLTEIRNRSIIAYLLEHNGSAEAWHRVGELAGVTKAKIGRWHERGFITDITYYKLCPES